MQAKLAAQNVELAQLRKGGHVNPAATPQAVIVGKQAAVAVPYSSEWSMLGVGVCAPDLELQSLALSPPVSPAAPSEDAVT